MAEKNDNELKFEEALAKIDAIVHQVEEGKIGLDESVEKYEEGMTLIRFCQEKLNQAEKRIETIEKTAKPPAKATE